MSKLKELLDEESMLDEVDSQRKIEQVSANGGVPLDIVNTSTATAEEVTVQNKAEYDKGVQSTGQEYEEKDGGDTERTDSIDNSRVYSSGNSEVHDGPGLLDSNSGHVEIKQTNEVEPLDKEDILPLDKSSKEYEELGAEKLTKLLQDSDTRLTDLVDISRVDAHLVDILTEDELELILDENTVPSINITLEDISLDYELTDVSNFHVKEPDMMSWEFQESNSVASITMEELDFDFTYDNQVMLDDLLIDTTDLLFTEVEQEETLDNNVVKPESTVEYDEVLIPATYKTVVEEFEDTREVQVEIPTRYEVRVEEFENTREVWVDTTYKTITEEVEVEYTREVVNTAGLDKANIKSFKDDDKFENGHDARPTKTETYTVIEEREVTVVDVEGHYETETYLDTREVEVMVEPARTETVIETFTNTREVQVVDVPEHVELVPREVEIPYVGLSETDIDMMIQNTNTGLIDG